MQAAWLATAKAWTAVLLPPGCFGCGGGLPRAFEGGVCPGCWEAFGLPQGPACAVCDLPIAAPGAALLESPLCGRCQADPPAFDALKAAVRYEGPPAEVLKAFKYAGADYLAPHLARRIAPRAVFETAPLALVPVPATRRERRRRGYFPAGDLARALARELGLPCVALLTKVRETERQASLPLPARRANVRGAFSAAAAPETVLLVDDVATSGCTLDACARALKRAGARRVFAAAFARALPEAG